MKVKNIIFAAILILAILPSCTITQKMTPVAPLNVQVNFSMDDLEFLGTVEGSSSQDYVLGLPLGGRKYHQGMLLQNSLLGNINVNSRGMNNALYDALTSKEGIDFILPVSYEISTEQGFMGNTKHTKVKAKAFKIKTK